MTCVIGLDLALRTTGYAVVDYDTGGLIDYDLIATHPNGPIEHRLRVIAARVAALVKVWQPLDVWKEDPIAHRSGTTTIRLAMVHGAVATIPNLTINGLNPSAIKRHATGRGNADKTAMIAAARKRWGVTLSADEADAAWVADLGRQISLNHFQGDAS